MRKINLKIWPEYFKEILTGNKRFELRKNDRDYEVGDILILEEWCPSRDGYTGNTIKCVVTYILKDGDIPIDFGINIKNSCIMSIKVFETYVQC